VPGSLISEILNFELKDYYEKNLNERYSFFRKVSIENIMKYESMEISRSLTKMANDLEVIAIQLFKSNI
jgi:hypothetical protein